MWSWNERELRSAGNAFDRAWDRFLLTGALTAQNMIETRRILAVRILCKVADGENDEWQLARDALFHLWGLHYGGNSLAPVLRGGQQRRVGRTRTPRNEGSAGR